MSILKKISVLINGQPIDWNKPVSFTVEDGKYVLGKPDINGYRQVTLNGGVLPRMRVIGIAFDCDLFVEYKFGIPTIGNKVGFVIESNDERECLYCSSPIVSFD